MGRIRQDLYRDPSRIQNAYGIGALEICRQMEAFSNIFGNIPAFVLSIQLPHYNSQRSSSSSHEMFDRYFSSFGSTDTYILSAFRSLGLSRNRRLGDQWQPATIGGNCHSTVSGRILFKNLWYLLLNIYVCSQYERLFGPRQRVFFMVLLRLYSSFINRSPRWNLDTSFDIFLPWSHSCPTRSDKTDSDLSVKKGPEICLVGMSYSKQQHIANVAGGVIREHACTH